MLAVLAVTAVLPSHGSLLYPLPRGGVDRDLPPFNTGHSVPGKMLNLFSYISTLSTLNNHTSRTHQLQHKSD